MALRCTTFILRVGTEATKARIWMDSNDEIIETSPSFDEDEAGNPAVTIQEWGGDFKYTLGLPRALGTRPDPTGIQGTVPNLFQIEWKPPTTWPPDPDTNQPREAPMPVGIDFTPERPITVDANGNQVGKADEQDGEITGTAPYFPRDVTGEFDWTGRIRFHQPDPSTPPAGWTDTECEGAFS